MSINISLITETDEKKLYKISDKDNKDIYLKLTNIRLPFNIQKYQNNFYLNCELFSSDKQYSQNISLINMFEDYIKLIINASKTFNSCIKNRGSFNDVKQIHIKTQLKKQKKKIDVITQGNKYLETINLDELDKNKDNRYEIILKPTILWENKNEYGISYFVYRIKTLADD